MTIRSIRWWFNRSSIELVGLR